MDMELIKKYSPNIYFDLREPFFPVRIGCTVFDKTNNSPSFKREINFDNEKIKCVIEYAIYWDFDIQHLFELEHVWVYVDKNGNVFDCEASFHGKYLKGLSKDKSNIEDSTHVKLYSQPGKHAFSPIIELFELIPDIEKANYEDVGKEGLVITSIAKGRYSTNDEINHMVESYMQQFRFRPLMQFEKYNIKDELFTDWETLDQEIPLRINKMIKRIRREV